MAQNLSQEKALMNIYKLLFKRGGIWICAVIFISKTGVAVF